MPEELPDPHALPVTDGPPEQDEPEGQCPGGPTPEEVDGDA